MDDRFARGIKGILLGGFLGAGALMLLVVLFKSDFGVEKVLPGMAAGAALGFILGVCLPKSRPFPKDLTPLTFLVFSAFSFWVVADGVMHGEIHGMPRSGWFVQGFRELYSWKEKPGFFLLTLLMWMGLGIGCATAVIWNFLKATRNTSTLASLPGARTVLSIYNWWRELPESVQIVILVMLALSPLLYFAVLGLSGR